MPQTLEVRQALVSVDGLKGSDIRRVRANNRILTDVCEAGHPMATEIARTRWLTLGLTRKEHAKAAGIDPHAQMNVERKDSFPQHETYASIYKYWKARSISEQTLQRFLDLLTDREYNRLGQPLKQGEKRMLTVLDLYRRWGYQVGFSQFERMSAEVMESDPLTYGALWQRRSSGTVPDFQEVILLARGLAMDEEEAQAVWSRDRMKQLLGCRVPEPYASFLIRIELKTEASFDALRIAQKLDITQDLGKKLTRCEFVPYGQISDVAERLFSARELPALERAWKQVEADRAGRESFGDAFVRIRDAQGITNRHLSSILQIRPPEERIAGYESKRRETYRPSGAVRATYQEMQCSQQAPAGVLVSLVSRPQETVEGGRMSEPEYLRQLFSDTLNERYRSQRSSLQDSSLRIEREYWGIDPDTLAQASGLDREKILLLERGKGADDSATMDRLQKTVRTLAREKVAFVDTRRALLLEEQQRLPTTIAEFVPLLARQKGGYLPLWHATQQGSDQRAGITANRLKGIGIGKCKEILPLPSFRHIASSAGSAVSPALEKDWYLQFPTYLETREESPMPDQLARLVWTQVCSCSTSAKKFCENYLNGLSYSLLTRDIQRMNRGDYPQWATVSRYLSGVGHGVDDPVYLFAQLLHQTKENRNNMRQRWMTLATSRGFEPFDAANKFGFGVEALRKFLHTSVAQEKFFPLPSDVACEIE